MIKNWRVVLFLLGCAGVFLVFLFEQGVFVRRTEKLGVAERSEGVLTALVKKLPPMLCMRQEGARMTGPYDSIVELETAPEGSYVAKGNRFYIKPYAGRAASFTLDWPYQLPVWSGMAFSILAGVGLLLMFAGRARPAAPVQAGRKLPQLDGLRGWACLIVVFFHYCIALIYRERFGAEPIRALVQPFPLGLLSAGDFCVHVFFVLSGIVLSLPYLRMERGAPSEKLRSAMVRRPFRLLGMMLPVLIAAYLLGYGMPPADFMKFSGYAAPTPDVGTFLSDLFTAPFSRGQAYVPPFWTLWYELYGSLGLFAGLWLMQGMGFPRRLILYGVGVLLLHGSAFLDFLAGAAIAEAMVAGIFPVRSVRSIWAVSLVTVAGLFLACYNNELGTTHAAPNVLFTILKWFAPLTSWAALLVVVGVVNLASFQRLLSARPVQFLGHISYAHYAIHWLVIYSIAAPLAVWLRKSQGMEIAGAWSIGWIACAPVCLGLGWAATQWIDEPAIRLSKWIAGRLLGSGVKDSATVSISPKRVELGETAGAKEDQQAMEGAST